MINKDLEPYLDKFKEKVLPIDYHRRGILPSEGFVVCALCDLYNIDILIESGIANGMSTEIFAKYGVPKVIGVERAIKPKEVEMFAGTKKRLAKHKNITLIKGNSLEVIPQLLSENSSSRIALVIDGPKDTAACNLLRDCMKDNNNIVLGIIHDQKTKQMKKFFKDTIFTDDKALRDFDFLDKGIKIPKPVYGIKINGA